MVEYYDDETNKKTPSLPEHPYFPYLTKQQKKQLYCDLLARRRYHGNPCHGRKLSGLARGAQMWGGVTMLLLIKLPRNKRRHEEEEEGWDGMGRRGVRMGEVQEWPWGYKLRAGKVLGR